MALKPWLRTLKTWLRALETSSMLPIKRKRQDRERRIFIFPLFLGSSPGIGGSPVKWGDLFVHETIRTFTLGRAPGPPMAGPSTPINSPWTIWLALRATELANIQTPSRSLKIPLIRAQTHLVCPQTLPGWSSNSCDQPLQPPGWPPGSPLAGLSTPCWLPLPSPWTLLANPQTLWLALRPPGCL